MKMLSEFRVFALRGNVVDLTVGVIIGAAFGRIVDSMVRDLLMPLVGLFVAGLDFSNWFVLLNRVTAAEPPPAPASQAVSEEVLLLREIRDVIARSTIAARATSPGSEPRTHAHPRTEHS